MFEMFVTQLKNFYVIGLFVRSLNNANILGLLRVNSVRLAITCSVLKMKYVFFIVHLQVNAKEFHYFIDNRENCLKFN